ncbi:type I polyketide synthase [Saccharothrix australiensis]|uniref:Enediyne polyketide synthase n=1 Tax=Saccharothrix australiensis TaxID=2072 RepID=A0A495W1G4_9PSEU|nr:type I polyketide synthase [Saccharothrix australiensis]RKT54573.1 enediyne polyketide synthase [Saccharothrix australiensis]
MKRGEQGEPIAIVGMACRYPDADDPAGLWQAVLERRRAFRRLPPQRLDLDDYWDPDPSAPDKTYGTHAAVLENWCFDRREFRIPSEVHRAADPAHWLALETAARALADAGHPAGAGLDRDRVAVVVGNSLTGEVTRARTLRLRWPYVRRVLEAELPEVDGGVLERIRRRYLAAFPEVGDETLAGGLANTIAGRICNQFDFHGGGYTVDGACASSLLAVITVCRALRDRGADFGIAGGVDLSLDPFELVGFAKTGALANGDMRIYDERSAGFLPGEGCGMLALMRAEDARAAGVAVYAEILGWGVSSDGRGGITRPEVAGQLLALRRASGMAGIDHAEIALYEGHGTGTAVGDRVELTALNQARAGAPAAAALGSVKANIGHTKAAAGVAGVIKAVLSVASGTLPPTTGCVSPHPALRPALRVLPAGEPWPAGPRFAGVSAMGFGGVNAHLVLGRDTARQSHRSVSVVVADRRAPAVEVVAVSGADPARTGRLLTRIAALAPRLSLAELRDLACHLGRLPPAGGVRAALAVRTPEELGACAARAAAELAGLPGGKLVSRRGTWLGNQVAGRVTLLFPGQGVGAGDTVDTARVQPTVYRAGLAAVARLDELGVEPVAAIGHSLGEITALAWSGRLSAADGERLVVERGRIMADHGAGGTGMMAVATGPAEAAAMCSGTGLVVAADNGPRAQVLAGALTELRAVAEAASRRGVAATMLPVSHAFHTPAMSGCAERLHAVLRTIGFRPSPRVVVSTVYGRPLDDEDLVEALTAQVLAPVRFWPAVHCALAGTDLFCEAGPGDALSALVALGCDTPAVSLEAADAAAALFCSTAAKDLAPLFAGRFARPFDLWREPEFLANPCSAPPPQRPPVPAVSSERDRAESPVSVITRLLAEATELDRALIQPGTRLVGDLNISSLRAAQLVAAAAKELGRRLDAVPASVSDCSVAELAALLLELPARPASESDGPVDGVRPWLRCFTERTVPARPEPGPPARTASLPVPSEPGALLDLARYALRAKALVVTAHDTAASGFLRSLCLEHPEIGITLVRLPAGRSDAPPCHAEPGRWRELVVDGSGSVSEPVEQPLDLRPVGRLPLGDRDVLLVSGGGKGIGYACARALARSCGVALAVIGRARPDTDETLRCNLDRLREDRVRHAYRSVDVADRHAVRQAVAELSAELGPVTAVLHAAGINEPTRFEHLDAERMRRHLAPKVSGLHALLSAVPARQLRLLVTFGSVIGRRGLAGESHYALANGVLRAEVERLRLPGCRVLNVDWSVWAGVGMAERLGAVDALARGDITPISVEEGTDLLLRLLSGPDTPVSVSVHGRLGDPAPVANPGRFVERVRAHQPGVELVADAVLSLRTDPWLAEHRLDGLAVLPAVVGLEAMAQAASALAGRALTVAERVVFDRPVVVPDSDGAVRVCALRHDGVVETVLRSAESGFADHFRAQFPLRPTAPGVDPITVAGADAVDAGDLYGPLLFHTGRFRRIAAVSVPDPRSCRATVTPDPGGTGFDPVLGSPTVNDASVHALQACVPHQRLLPVGCDRVELDPTVPGPWELHGVERRAAPTAGGGEYTWDVVALGSAARHAIRWTGLRLAGAGALPSRPLAPPLLAAMLTRSAIGIGLDPSLSISVATPFAVEAGGDCPVACDWQFVEPRGHPRGQSPDAELVRALTGAGELPPDALAARARTIRGCLDRLRCDRSTVRFAGAYDGGWLLLRCGGSLIASVIVPVPGQDRPVAISVLTAGAPA